MNNRMTHNKKIHNNNNNSLKSRRNGQSSDSFPSVESHRNVDRNRNQNQNTIKNWPVTKPVSSIVPWLSIRSGGLLVQ